MRSLYWPVVIVPMALAAPALCQVTFPDCYIQNWNWTSGAHHYTVPQPLYSPGDPNAPVTSTGTANTEFVSATQVRLTPGFHAGDLSGDGRFRAYINTAVGDPDDLVVISPDASQISDGILHVNKWEKLELGYKLPQTHRDAIASFFENYYPYTDDPNDPDDNSDPWISAPSNTDAAHDLNPYAYDSLQLVMYLTSPSGQQSMKWGFYMKEGRWQAQTPNSKLLPAFTTDPLYPFNVRFRCAPDEEGLWQFSLSIKAPFTTTLTNESLPEVNYAGYAFVCDPALPDNLGPLSVNTNNDRTLWFEGSPDPGDETPFFGLGVNMGKNRNVESHTGTAHWTNMYWGDYNSMTTAMDKLHGVGGNLMRFYLMRNNFAPEWVNLGVYDAFKTPEVCDGAFQSDCTEPNEGWSTNVVGNCQWQCWAFDRILEHARANNIYIQLCIDPYPPIVDYEKFIWGAHPYVVNFLEPARQQPPLNPYNMREFFYLYGDPIHKNTGVFYYWKRRYQYIMARWGYSVNLPIIEPFNEIDQMLSYRDNPLEPDPEDPCDGATCMENRVHWTADPLLRQTIDQWVTDINTFIKGDQQLGDPVHSPLGEKKLFLMSYAGGSPTDVSYHLPFTNEHVDLIDAHRAPDNQWDLRGYVENAKDYRNNTEFQTDGHKKPFHHGEWTSYGNYHFPDERPYIFEYGGSYGLFDNYDVSFHNELWASTFSDCFAAGTTWGWERVFWFPNSLPHDEDSGLLPDPGNPDYPIHSGAPNITNHLFMGYIGDVPAYADVKNAPLYHHFKPLSDFLNKPSVQALGLFTSDYTPHVIEANGIECLYLQNADGIAVGWVHNTNAYWYKSFYITSVYEHYMDCATPAAQSIDLTGFEERPHYYVSYFPTRVDATEWPADYDDDDGNGSVHLRFNNPTEASLNGAFPLSLTETYRNHLDTLHSDYAFIVSPAGYVKSLRAALDTVEVGSDWDFAIYPNPARDEVFLRLQGDEPKDISIHDLAGRQVTFWGSVTSPAPQLPVGHLAKGAYWIRVSNGVCTKTKKLLVH